MDEVAKPILDLFCTCFCQEFGDRMGLDQNVRTLSRDMEELATMFQGVKDRVDLAEGRLKLVRTTEVRDWLESVEKLDGEVADVEGEFEAGREPLPSWWRAPARWWGRCQLSRRVASMLREARYLKRRGDFKVVAETPKPAPASRLVHRRVGNTSSGSAQ